MSSGTKYYGGYFWMAVISFIVPLFVAVKAFQELAPTTKPTPAPDVSGVDNNLWDYLLKGYVAGGLVDYQAMRKDHLFHLYLQQLGAAQPEKLESDNDRLALMCNAYNAFVINGVIAHKITDSVDGFEINGNGFFDLKEHIFAGKTISLNDLEHRTIRPTFHEPRVHVALVCAARSCPSIRGEAYIGERIEQQLQDQSIQFANSKKYVGFDETSGKVTLSPILSWYGSDWDERFPNGGYLRWIADLVEDETLKGQVEGAIGVEDGKTFVTYDWALNSQAEPGTHSGAKKSGDFGSGSIPDE